MRVSQGKEMPNPSRTRQMKARRLFLLTAVILLIMSMGVTVCGADSDLELSVEKMENEQAVPSFGGDYDGFDFFDAENVKLMKEKQTKREKEILRHRALILSASTDQAASPYQIIGATAFNTMLIETGFPDDERAIPQQILWILSLPAFGFVLIFSMIHYRKKRNERLRNDDYNYDCM